MVTKEPESVAMYSLEGLRKKQFLDTQVLDWWMHDWSKKHNDMIYSRETNVAAGALNQIAFISTTFYQTILRSVEKGSSLPKLPEDILEAKMLLVPDVRICSCWVIQQEQEGIGGP